MRGSTKLLAGLVALAGIAAAPALVNAEDDNNYDGKGYPGMLCLPANNLWDWLHVTNGNYYFNDAPQTAPVLCPVVQDSWQQTGGLSYNRIWIYNPTGNTFTCTTNSYSADGVFQASASFSTTTAGKSGQYLVNSSGGYVSKTGAEGYIVITCQVPVNGRIYSYVVQERA